MWPGIVLHHLLSNASPYEERDVVLGVQKVNPLMLFLLKQSCTGDYSTLRLKTGMTGTNTRNNNYLPKPIHTVITLFQ